VLQYFLHIYHWKIIINKDANAIIKCTNTVTILFIGQKNFFISRVHGIVFIHMSLRYLSIPRQLISIQKNNY